MTEPDAVEYPLPAWLTACDPTRWPILCALTDKNEDELRSILRPHEDQALRRADDQIIGQRVLLDAALDELTLIEIAFQFGLLSQEHLERLRKCGDFERLCGSDAFLRYVTAYQYFGVRMLAGRLFPPPSWNDPENAVRDEADINKRTFAIGYPPPLLNLPRAREWFSKMIELLAAFSPPPGGTPGLNFLDGFYSGGEKQSEAEGEEPQQFELWLRGLLPEASAERQAHFRDLETSMLDWADQHAHFYDLVQTGSVSAKLSSVAKHPAIARFALIDVYWFRRLLRAEVSMSGRVVYAPSTWFKSMRDRALLDRNMGVEETFTAEKIFDILQLIRSVFDLVCDLAQNAAELAEELERKAFEPELHPQLRRHVRRWRQVFDEELSVIEKQRQYRTYASPEAAMVPEPPVAKTNRGPSNPQQLGFPPEGWSQRLLTGMEPRHRIGLAFSGGGIRSATFNLGVLQGLQEFDLLRHIDYLSTVSGGGFIGSWLVANVKRTRHWLGKATSWDESIAHLRSYSKYLAPITGILSADTWSMATAWVRNTFLVQLTTFTWLLALFSAVVLVYKGFYELIKCYPHPGFQIAIWSDAGPALSRSCNLGISIISCMVAVLAIPITAALAYNFMGHRIESGKHTMNAKWVRRLTVIPSWISALLITLMLWYRVTSSDAQTEFSSFTKILVKLICIYPVLFGMEWLALWILAAITLTPPPSDDAPIWVRMGSSIRYIVRAIPDALFGVAVLYLAIAGVVDLFAYWAFRCPHDFQPLVFVLGPTLVLAAFALSVLILIGLTGRWTIEAQREWWTRFGAWLAMFGTVTLLLAAATIYGPWLPFHLPLGEWYSKVFSTTAVTGWIGTILGGLFAGRSSKTSGEDTKSRAPNLEKLANVGGLLFLVTIMVLAATALKGFLAYNASLPIVSSTYYEVISHSDTKWRILIGTLLVLVGCGLVFSWCFEINIFGLNQFYRNRLVRCYLGATRWTPGLRKPHSFTKFDFHDDMPLQGLMQAFSGPFPIFNCTLNLAGSSDLALNTRHSSSFSLTPLYCGADRPKVGFAPTDGFSGDIKLGQAVSISGAAASPNMGYNSSPLVAFLLTMFNVRLGWWFPNPGRRCWRNRGLRQSLYYLTRELLGMADENRDYLNVSDGGHFENLGVYELIRRRCEVIIACDAECDESLQFSALGNMLRICETDFGAIIDLDVKSIREQKDGHSLSHCAIGRIKYDNGSTGYLIYLKASVTGDEEVGVSQYRAAHPSFPHETTANQFFSEGQFDSYRKLGHHIVRKVFGGTRPGETPLEVAEQLTDMFAPAGSPGDAFLKHTQTLARILESFRASAPLHPWFQELMGVSAAIVTQPIATQPIATQPNSPTPNPPQGSPLKPEECVIGMELIQLMEDVFLDLRLEEFWGHPDNRGWAILFMRWARSPKFQTIWKQTHRTFGIRFEYFMSTKLGMFRDKPIVRIG
jgi:hypothetical protein